MANNDSGYRPGDYNKSGMIMFIGSFGFSILFFFYLGYMDNGIHMGEINKEQMLENEMRAKGEVIKKFKVADVAEPWLSSEDMLKHGAKIYKQNCTTCHGDAGMGDGPSSAGLKPAPRNLVKGPWKKGGKSIELFTTLTNGFAPGSSMASYKHLKVGDRWALVHFVRSITEDKPEDDAAELKAFATQQK